MTNLIDVMKNTCQETIKKAKNSYGKIKGLYEKGILSFYENEKKYIFGEIEEKKEEKYNFLINYETPVKDLRRSPSFSNFDSEVKVESTGEKKNRNNYNSDNKKSKNGVKYLTFNEKNEENHKKFEFSAKKTRKNDDSAINVETLLKKISGQQDEIIEYSMKSLKNDDSAKNSEYEMNSRIKNEELKIEETLNYSKKSSEYEMNCRVIDKYNSGQSLKNSQGLFLKKSNELNLRGKIRYSDE